LQDLLTSYDIGIDREARWAWEGRESEEREREGREGTLALQARSTSLISSLFSILSLRQLEDIRRTAARVGLRLPPPEEAG